jgi:hypothetical protein
MLSSQHEHPEHDEAKRHQQRSAERKPGINVLMGHSLAGDKLP